MDNKKIASELVRIAKNILGETILLRGPNAKMDKMNNVQATEELIEYISTHLLPHGEYIQRINNESFDFRITSDYGTEFFEEVIVEERNFGGGWSMFVSVFVKKDGRLVDKDRFKVRGSDAVKKVAERACEAIWDQVDQDNESHYPE